MKILQKFVNQDTGTYRDFERVYTAGDYHETAKAVLNSQYTAELRRLYGGDTELIIWYKGGAVFKRKVALNKADKTDINELIDRKVHEYYYFLNN